jgi:hypothetical protein
MYIQNYNCITAAGSGVHSLMEALNTGRDCSQKESSQGLVCSIPSLDKSIAYRENFKTLLTQCWRELEGTLAKSVKDQLRKKRVALVFSSTKGLVEDFVWKSTAQDIRQKVDPFDAIIEDFCQIHNEIDWQLCCNISNACASSHVACEYIQTLFEADRTDFALQISADLIGPFIFKGFSSLKIVSATSNRPFSQDRDGLQLGDAVAMVLFSSSEIKPLENQQNDNSAIELVGSESNTEGASITRPSHEGEGLVRSMQALYKKTQSFPDLVIAHGTGTSFNDLAEDLALKNFLPNKKTPVTCTKWSIGHTLGASGTIDMIAACEILKSQKAFRIHNTTHLDKIFEMNYLVKESVIQDRPSLRQIWINSLGFGGVHASLAVRLS